MGKLFHEAQGEVDLSADILDSTRTTPRNSWRVIFCMEPWNFPYYQLARVAGPNLMVGNTLIVKHAPNVPQCALAFERLFLDAGLPAGAYTNVFISNEQSAQASPTSVSKAWLSPEVSALAPALPLKPVRRSRRARWNWVEAKFQIKCD
jgi:acyl-CoA reductase-like NAD-dependent aldehyde dehydrogenase